MIFVKRIKINNEEWIIYQLTGIRTEYTGRADVIHPYFIAISEIHFPLEAKTLEQIQSDIMDFMGRVH